MYPFPTLSPCSHHRFLRPQSTLRSSLLFTQTLRLLPTSSLLLLLSLTSHRTIFGRRVHRIIRCSSFGFLQRGLPKQLRLPIWLFQQRLP
jgi:hypothetical protein